MFKQPTHIAPEMLDAFRAYERNERVNNTKIGCVLVLTLMPAGVPMDFFVYPGHFWLFLRLRLFSALVAGSIWAIMQTGWGRRRSTLFGWIIPFVPVFFITWMIAASDGFRSPYYAGLNLVLLAVGAVLRWTFLESIVFVSAVFLIYVTTGLLLREPLQTSVLANNFFFISVMDVIVVVGTFYAYRQRLREFVLRFELDANRKKIEESNRKLTELDQIKGRFFANISHELRTPLTLIISPLESILARYRNALAPDAVGLLQTMHKNGLRLLKLINDLLDLVRLDSGVMEVRREPVALAQFLDGMASAARQIAEDKQIHLVVTVASDVNAVMVDRDKMEKIILNLQFNALKFTPAGGRVELRADKEGEDLVLRVSDTGIGIPKKDLPNVFGRFFQVDSSARRKFQGVGIGLALVKELTELHGGQVSVQSVEGQGTTFTARMPYVAADPAAVAASVVSAQSLPAEAQPQTGADGAPAQAAGTDSGQEWLSNLYHRANLFGGADGDKTAPSRAVASILNRGHTATVLIADDQPDMLRFLQSELAPHYNVIAVTDGQQAVDKAAEAAPDIILLDMMMPEKDGMQACREIRAAPATRNVPIVLVTAHVDEETKLNALRAGASDFLPKPFSTTELHVRVKNLVESYEFQRQLGRQNRTLASTIEQLKDTETQLVQTEKLASLGRMSAGIIHEINNPLNFATTGLYSLRNIGKSLPESDRADYEEVLRDVEDGLKRVKTIVTDLRSFSHHENEKLDAVDVSEIVTSSLRFLSNEWKDKVRIEQNLPEHLTLLANKNKIIQVLVNLLQNSMDALRKKDFGADHATIRIDGRQENGNTFLSIRDNGEGIDPQHMDKVFDPFFTTKDVGEGMGLGLSICYRIVQEYEGRISVQSERGKYCEFTLEFPSKESETAVAVNE